MAPGALKTTRQSLVRAPPPGTISVVLVVSVVLVSVEVDVDVEVVSVEVEVVVVWPRASPAGTRSTVVRSST